MQEPVSTGHDAPMTMRVQGLLGDMRPAVRRVAELVLASPAQVSEMTITELADQAQVSASTVVRFCRYLGLASYSALKVGLAAEVGGRAEAEARFEGDWDIRSTDPLDEAVEKAVEADFLSVQGTVRSVDISLLAQLGVEIAEARRIDVFGIGASALVARDLQQKLTRIGLMAFAWTDAHEAASAATLLDSMAVAVGISHSGATRDVVAALHMARDGGAKTVAITGAPRSALAYEADNLVVTAAFETTFRSAAMGSRLAQLVVVDGIFTAVAHATYESAIRALASSRKAVEHLKVAPSERGSADYPTEM